MRRIASYVLIGILAAALAAPVAAAPVDDPGAAPAVGWWSWAGWAVGFIQRQLSGAGTEAAAIGASEADCGPAIDPIDHCATANAGDGDENGGDRGPEIDPVG